MCATTFFQACESVGCNFQYINKQHFLEMNKRGVIYLSLMSLDHPIKGFYVMYSSMRTYFVEYGYQICSTIIKQRKGLKMKQFAIHLHCPKRFTSN